MSYLDLAKPSLEPARRPDNPWDQPEGDPDIIGKAQAVPEHKKWKTYQVNETIRQLKLEFGQKPKYAYSPGEIEAARLLSAYDVRVVENKRAANFIDKLKPPPVEDDARAHDDTNAWQRKIHPDRPAHELYHAGKSHDEHEHEHEHEHDDPHPHSLYEKLGHSHAAIEQERRIARKNGISYNPSGYSPAFPY